MKTVPFRIIINYNENSVFAVPEYCTNISNSIIYAKMDNSCEWWYLIGQYLLYTTKVLYITDNVWCFCILIVNTLYNNNDNSCNEK